MKKIVIFLTLVITCLSIQISASAITSDEASSNTYLKNHGYSPETIRLINLSKAQINGKPYSDDRKLPEWCEEHDSLKFLRNVYIKIDPAMDDELFMEHEIQYSTHWNEL